MNTEEKDKSTLQKLYEKRRMIEMDPGGINVMHAVRSAGASRRSEAGLYLCVGDVPVAKLLPQKEIDETVPDFDKSDVVEFAMAEMRKVDPRTSIEEMDKPVGAEFEETFLKIADEIESTLGPLPS